MEYLKPCPFCGGEGRELSDVRIYKDDKENTWYWIACDNCKCTTDIYNSPEFAVDQWNRRTDPWLPAEDKLPDEGVSVLVCNKASLNDNVSVAMFFSQGSYSDMIWLDIFGQPIKVTHWCPLPVTSESMP